MNTFKGIDKTSRRIAVVADNMPSYVKYLCIMKYSLRFDVLCGIQFLFIWR